MAEAAGLQKNSCCARKRGVISWLTQQREPCALREVCYSAILWHETRQHQIVCVNL